MKIFCTLILLCFVSYDILEVKAQELIALVREGYRLDELVRDESELTTGGDLISEIDMSLEGCTEYTYAESCGNHNGVLANHAFYDNGNVMSCSRRRKETICTDGTNETIFTGSSILYQIVEDRGQIAELFVRVEEYDGPLCEEVCINDDTNTLNFGSDDPSTCDVFGWKAVPYDYISNDCDEITSTNAPTTVQTNGPTGSPSNGGNNGVGTDTSKATSDFFLSNALTFVIISPFLFLAMI